MSATIALPLLLVLVLGQAAAPAQAQLTLAEVYDLAGARNPRLRAASAVVDAAVAREPGAGVPADPTFQLGVMNLSPRLRSDMPTTMVAAIQAMQMLPWPGKRRAARRAARTMQRWGRAVVMPVPCGWMTRARVA
jgi:hypothetical protein